MMAEVIDHESRQVPFGSFAQLRQWHKSLVGSTTVKDRAAAGPVDPDVLRSRIWTVQATGTNIAAEDERRSAQNILDYWAAELISAAPDELEAWSPPRLAQFEDTARGPAPVDENDASDTALAKERIRLAASARLWRDSGRKEGYLLYGKALEDAKRLSDGDRDIAELVAASEKTVARRSRFWQIAGVGAFLALIGLAAVLFTLLRESEQARKGETAARQMAEMDKELAERAADQSAEEARRARLAGDSARIRLAELGAVRQQLDAALTLIRQELAAGRLDRSRIPPLLIAPVEALDDTVVPRISSASDAPLAGYNPDFLLGSPLPLPGTGGTPGREVSTPLNYVHYSLVLAPARRMALFTASNVDRQRLRVLPRFTAGFAPDPRVPLDQQPEPGWFSARDIDQGHLVTRQEIAWGRGAAGDEAEASRRLIGMVNVYTNITPQFDTFNRNIWAQLERWVLTEHNKRATRISLLSGPVLRDDDPVVMGVKLPRRFWKIAVSPRADGGGGLVVDTFLVPQLRGDTAEKLPAADFQPEQYRVNVSEIERATGLDLGAALRDADTGDALQDPSGYVKQDVAAGAAQAMLNDLGRPGLPDADQRRIVSALAETAGHDDFRKLPPDEQASVLAALAAIPQQDWDRPEWIDLKASLRRAVADLAGRDSPPPAVPTVAALAGRDSPPATPPTEAAPAGRDSPPPAPRISGFIGTLKSRLGLERPRDATVYFQFAGMTRGDAVAISNDLKALGWKIPGEQRTGAAARQNEVRYGAPADAQAAALLAADLRAQGQRRVTRAVQNRDIKPGTIEIWISQ